MTNPFIVTLDGPAGVGKSTLAKQVAAALEVAYLDTGAMFRTIALQLAAEPDFGPVFFDAARAGVYAKEPLSKQLQKFHFSLQGSGGKTELVCNNKPMGQEIRTENAGMLAATIAVLPEVRAFLALAQQGMGGECSLVAEGRDMGTVIFPQAQCKIFLDATPEVRAARRYAQLAKVGDTPDLAILTEQIRQRDAQDRNRDIAPLRPAKEANIIDTSDKDIEGVFKAIMAAVYACSTLRQRA